MQIKTENNMIYAYASCANSQGNTTSNSVKRISMTLACSLLNAERTWLIQNFDKSKLHFIEQIYPLI